MKKIFVSILAIAAFSATAQISGNVAYRENNNYGDRARTPQKSITLQGNQFTISTRILMNVRPDVLVVTLGVSQDDKTVKGCNEAIKKRIDGFLKEVKAIGVKEQDVYVDFISQNKIYDYDESGRVMIQEEAGFEVKKNIIVRLKDVKAFGRLTDLASGFEIHDIIKAEYINENVDALYVQLFDEAVKTIEAKKERYSKRFNVLVSDDFNTLQDNYYSIQPRTQYQQYAAFETSNVSSNYNYIRKEARKAKTFYYQGIDTSSFDRVINPSIPEVCLQYVVEMEIVYHIKK